MPARSSVAWYAWSDLLSYAQTWSPLWIRLYSDVSSRIETRCLSGPSAATRRVWVPDASSVIRSCGSALEPPLPPAPPGAKDSARPPSDGMPRSVLIFTVPESCSVSEAAIFSMSFCALIFGRSGSPLLASAGTSPIVAAATPATATGTM